MVTPQPRPGDPPGQETLANCNTPCYTKSCDPYDGSEDLVTRPPRLSSGPAGVGSVRSWRWVGCGRGAACARRWFNAAALARAGGGRSLAVSELASIAVPPRPGSQAAWGVGESARAVSVLVEAGPAATNTRKPPAGASRLGGPRPRTRSPRSLFYI